MMMIDDDDRWLMMMIDYDRWLMIDDWWSMMKWQSGGFIDDRWWSGYEGFIDYVGMSLCKKSQSWLINEFYDDDDDDQWWWSMMMMSDEWWESGNEGFIDVLDVYICIYMYTYVVWTIDM